MNTVNLFLAKEWRQYTGEKVVFSANGAGTTGHDMSVDTDDTPSTKANSKWVTDLNVWCKTVKQLEDSIENLDDLGFDTDFLDTIPKVWSMKEIINKLNFIKSKNFCFVKDTVKRMKTQGTG